MAVNWQRNIYSWVNIVIRESHSHSGRRKGVFSWRQPIWPSFAFHYPSTTKKQTISKTNRGREQKEAIGS